MEASSRNELKILYNLTSDLDFIKKSSYICTVNAQRVKDMAVGDKYTSFVLP